MLILCRFIYQRKPNGSKVDIVSIGYKRKISPSELILKQNAKPLKGTMRHVLKGEMCSHKNNLENIIIPASSHNITFRLQDVTYPHVKLKKYFNGGFPIRFTRNH